MLTAFLLPLRGRRWSSAARPDERLSHASELASPLSAAVSTGRRHTLRNRRKPHPALRAAFSLTRRRDAKRHALALSTPRMPLACRVSLALHAHRDAHAAADAKRGEAALLAPALQFVEQRRQ